MSNPDYSAQLARDKIARHAQVIGYLGGWRGDPRAAVALLAALMAERRFHRRSGGTMVAVHQPFHRAQPYVAPLPFRPWPIRADN